MQNRNEEPDDLARRLEATGNYKILRRPHPQQPVAPLASSIGKVGVIVDFETTGLDANKEEIIEVAMVNFAIRTAIRSPASPAFSRPSTSRRHPFRRKSSS
jgi:Exonuclease